MVQHTSSGLSPIQLEHLKLQLVRVVPQLTRSQIFELADMFYEAARARRSGVFDESPSWDIRV